MTFEVEPRNWYRDEFLVSTEQRLLQVDAIRDAMDSGLVWWAQAPPADMLLKALQNSLCLGLYELPQSTSDIAGQGDPKQIGLARLITDGVTFGYLTDVYVLPGYQGKGLGRWMMACLDEVVKSWPHLRRMLLVTSGSSLDLYRKTLGMMDWSERTNQNLVLGLANGPAAVHASPERDRQQ
ncbi:putative acetyltransferase [Rosellinia necatrix]|uniref:Putative acetyltransferase n=1 Tax=Rosellinia necatrix TaxID=77044 RepID=A0A1S8A8L0_ROSNE|nr:putative acetyltransferase [Rosellinia necatrix]